MKAIRVGICTLIVFSVLSFGGVEPWGQAILEVGAAMLFALWGALAIRSRQVEVRWNWLFVPLFGLGTIAIAQYLFGLSFYPYLTKVELLRWAAYALLFFLALESFQTEEHVKQFVWFLVIFGFLVSLFGIIQNFTFNGKLYWTVALPEGAAPFGPYVDGDHFAGLAGTDHAVGVRFVAFSVAKTRTHHHLAVIHDRSDWGAGSVRVTSRDHRSYRGDRYSGVSFACASDQTDAVAGNNCNRASRRNLYCMARCE